VGQYLQVGLVLYELLCAAVEQADVGVTFLDGLSAEIHDETQHAVSGRMLGTKVEGRDGHPLMCKRVFVCEKETEQQGKVNESI